MENGVVQLVGRRDSSGLPWIWISMDIYVDIRHMTRRGWATFTDVGQCLISDTGIWISGFTICVCIRLLRQSSMAS